MTWGDDEHLRAILEFFDLKRPTTQVATRLLQILKCLDATSAERPSEETDTAHHETTEN